MALLTKRRIADAIHGTIELTEPECRVIDTASFQRLRHLKQLGLAHVTYPNATHTRFAHSLGVLRIMSQVVESASEMKFTDDDKQNLRLAALLHDVGHYPYSHLMERVDDVVLTEEAISDSAVTTITTAGDRYPNPEELGRLIVTQQPDLIGVLGKGRASAIADLFTRSEAANPQHSKLIHSSLDMDRLDYLLRDARAAGVPYGEVDMDYLLNSITVSPKGMVGIRQKALVAAEQFLLARYFMHRTVYYHKTTFGMEEAFRQLLRRCRDVGRYNVPHTGTAIRDIVTGPATLIDFTDHFADGISRMATLDADSVIQRLAQAVVNRRPPKLLFEACTIIDKTDTEAIKHNACKTFRRNCAGMLRALAKQHDVPLGCFLMAAPRAIQFEKRGNMILASEAGSQEAEAKDELIKIFVDGEAEPKSLVDVNEGLVRHIAGYGCHLERLYVLENDEEKVRALRNAVRRWAD